MTNIYKAIIEKEASFTKTLGRTLTGATIGAGIGAIKSNKDLDDPNKSIDEKALKLGGNSLGGAVVGGVAANTVGSLGSKAVGMFKKSEIEIPSIDDKEEKKEEKDNARDEVLNSPNKEEIERMNNSVVNSKKEEYKKMIEKEAEQYMKDTKCENCGYEGKMNSDDGRCPECQAMSGEKPKDVVLEGREQPYDRDLSRSRLYDEIENSRREFYSYY